MTAIYLKIFLTLVVAGLGIYLFYALLQNSNVSRRQKRVKLTLNTLLFLVLILFIWQPKFPVKLNSVIVFDQKVPIAYRQKLKDSLGIQNELTNKQFRNRIKQLDNNKIVLVGQQFSSNVLSRLAGKNISWIPYFEPESLQTITWSAVTRFGGRQTISGKIEMQEPKWIKLTYGNKTLDSTKLQKGFNSFSLSFPVFSVGKVAVALHLENKLLDSLHYFVKPSNIPNILMLLDYPDLESRILAEWLGQQGGSVETITSVAKSTTYKSLINAPSEKFDLIIAGLQFAFDTRLKKALNEGKSVLFWGLSHPSDEVSVINKALGSRFGLKRISNQDEIVLQSGFTSLPYAFTDFVNQKVVKDNSFAFQKNVGKLGVSLLKETFPVKLSGDSLVYARHWAEVISALQPADSQSWDINAPIFAGIPVEIITNQDIDLVPFSSKDTLFLDSNGEVGHKHRGVISFNESGWHSVGDSLELYIDSADKGSSQMMQQWIQANNFANKSLSYSENEPIAGKYWWFALLFCFTVLWVEGKFRY